MKLFRVRHLLFASGISLAVLLFLWVGLQNNSHVSAAPTAPDANTLINRPEDPVIVPGADLTALDGQLLDELKLYAFDGGSWSPIPFQFDERLNDITGTYVISEDGLLDNNDELVFMAKDAGQLAGNQEWPADTEARSNPRIQVQVNDPLSPGDMGWAYLYRSTTLVTDPTTYIDWNEALQTITALSYTASFTADFVGIADVTVNGNGVDILDRQKTRIDTAILDLDEEDLAGLLDPTVMISVVGPVRGVDNSGVLNFSIYGTRFDTEVAFDTSVSPLPVQNLRNSLDLNDPNLTGITNYFNSNGISVTIDGSNDPVGAAPRVDWFQASGASGGMVVAFPVVDVGGGTVTNYYLDDDTVDPGDTGDLVSYADSGLYISSPGQIINFALVTFILPPNSTTSVGADYFDRIDNPLTTTTTTQVFGQDEMIYMPAVFKP